MSEKKTPMKTRIGGQAVMEGIMMRGMKRSVLACRLPDGSIDVEDVPCSNLAAPPWYRKVPFLRGIFSFVESLVFGYRCLMRSAEKQDMLDTGDEELSPFEQKLTDLFGDKLFHIIMVIGAVLGVGLALILFLYLPALIVRGIDRVIPLGYGKAPVEGLIKIVVLVVYMLAVSRMKEIARTFSYHGAEHKSIACYEAGEELTVENVRRHSRFHPRCGTSFILIVLLVSVLVNAFLTWDNMAVRVILKLVMIPVVVGVAYEIIQFAGRHDNLLTRIISAPGLWLQRITTKEPDDSQIEVALAALKPVLPERVGEDRW